MDFPFRERDYLNSSTYCLGEKVVMLEKLKQVISYVTDPRVFSYVYSSTAIIVNFIDKFV